jgi:hypothetical protein
MSFHLAYEEPTLKKAWEAFCLHIATMSSIWGAYITLSGIGIGLAWLLQTISTSFLGSSDMMSTLSTLIGQLGQLPFTLLSSLVYVLFIAVPALYYERGEAITPERAFSQLLQDPLRYLLAGLLFSLAMSVGFVLCILPGIATGLVMPIYVNRIFLTQQPIPDAFASSFQTVYRSPQGWGFVGTQLLAGIMVLLSALCTCGLGLLVTVPMSSFYIQNAAYNKGLLR